MTRSRFVASCATLLIVTAAAVAQPGAPITPAFEDAELPMRVETVRAATGMQLVLDPQVHAAVTLQSSSPLAPGAFYQVFLSVLEAHGFTTDVSGGVLKILPDTTREQLPQARSTSDELVSQVIGLSNVSAELLVPILRPMIPPTGHLASCEPPNLLIVSDRETNVNRMIRIIRRIDQVGNLDVEMVPLHNTSSSEIVRLVNSLRRGAGVPATDSAGRPEVVADERSNTDLISADLSQRVRLRAPARYGQLAVCKPSNLLMSSDRAANVNRVIRIIRQIDQVADDAPAIVPNPGRQPEPPTSDEHLTRVLSDSDMHVDRLEAALRPELRPSFRLAVYSPSGVLDRDSSHQRLTDVIQHLDQSRGQTNWTRSFLTEAHVTVRLGHDPQDPAFDQAQIAEEHQALARPRGAYRTEPALLR
jgi:general secretion pathway protein D